MNIQIQVFKESQQVVIVVNTPTDDAEECAKLLEE